MQSIKIRGAKQHNLKNLNIDIPKNRLIVITGLSGSGKSSLAFDTIYAEGQRRYVESLSTYARQFLQLMPKPNIDSIEGLSPAISIEQKTTQNNPRSTVATVTEIYDYLRLLFARIGTPYSPKTGLPIKAVTINQIVEQIIQKPEKTKFLILAPIVREKKGEHEKILQNIQKKGFTRLKVNGEFVDIDNIPKLNKTHKHTICVVIDRLIKPANDQLELWKKRLSQSLETTLELSENIIWIENHNTKKIEVFSTSYTCPESGFALGEIEPRLFSFNSPIGACPECEGIGYHKYFSHEKQLCEKCKGNRLNSEALCIKINNLNISEVCKLSIKDVLEWVEHIQLSPNEQDIAEKILKEIKDRILFLKNVGLGYLTLNRESGTLSGGESQRIRLASQIGSQLTGVLYVLDEPSIGLHQRDNDKLLQTLKSLRDLGNTIIVVEHDEDTMNASDQIIDIGPESGIKGGAVIAQGTPQEIQNNVQSLTGLYLSKKKQITIPTRRRPGKGNSLIVNDANTNNLNNITAEFPLGKFICVTGVSGSGKSSLVMGTLCKKFHMKKNNFKGQEHIDKLIEITQKPIGRTPRSNPATYVGFWDDIRTWFANLPEAKTRGYKPGRFSFNVKGGRCETCAGDGTIRVSMHFLPDVFTTCEECKGKRFNPDTLDIHYNGKNISDILNMTIDEACKFFTKHPKILHKIQVLQQVGLGYLNVGHSATLLSGGEAQRIKLAKELSRRGSKDSLYILDEPTTGLHFEDIKKLLEVLHRFVDNGSTVIVIEHNLDIIKTADWVIDLGPEGGENGGKIIATGTPEEVAKNSNSITGFYLKRTLYPN